MCIHMTSRDACIYMHPTSSVQSSLYVDDILASADSDKKGQLNLFVKKVQKQFLVRIVSSLSDSWEWKFHLFENKDDAVFHSKPTLTSL